MPLEVPTTADWLKLVADLRTAQSSYGNRPGTGDLISDSVRDYFLGQSRKLSGVGIRRLFLQTSDANSVRYYELSAVDGHIAKIGRPPLAGNYRAIRSRALQLTEGATNPREGFRLQLTAHSDCTEESHQQATGLYCNTLAAEFIGVLRSRYFRQIEAGSSEIDRIHTQYKIDLIQPGTYAVRLAKALSNAVSARAAFYCILINNNIRLEYLNLNVNRQYFHDHGEDILRYPSSGWKHSARLLNGEPLAGAPAGELSEYTDRMTRKEHIVLGRESNLFTAFEKCAISFCNVNLNIQSVILSPVVYDSQVVGCYAFLLGSEVPAYSASARSLVVRSLDNFAAPARYLFQRRSSLMIVDPIFKSRDTRVSSDTCFIVMPFGESWSDSVFATVRNILSEEKLTVIRGDDLFGENVVEDIWVAMLKSSFIIADVTGRNPNVYYELGIAHTLGKKTVLLSQKVEDIPFDTRHLRHIIYSNSLAGFDTIKKGIRGFLSNR